MRPFPEAITHRQHPLDAEIVEVLKAGLAAPRLETLARRLVALGLADNPRPLNPQR